MSSIDYSSSVIWISPKTSLALRASQEQDSLARLQNPLAPGSRTPLSLHAEYEQQRHRNGTSRSHTPNIVLERLAERDWWTKSQSSLLNIYFRLSGFQSLLLLIHFRHGLNTCSHCTKSGTEPIPYVTPHFRDRLGEASPRYRNRAEITVLACDRKP